VRLVERELPRRVDLADLVVLVKHQGGDVDDVAGLDLALVPLLRVHSRLGGDILVTECLLSFTCLIHGPPTPPPQLQRAEATIFQSKSYW